MRWTLVYPPFEDRRDRAAYYTAPPLGLLSLSAHLKAANESEISLLDFVLQIKQKKLEPGLGLYEDCASRILETEPDIVALGTQCSTGPGAVQIARILKACKPDLLILFGGHDVTFLPKDYLESFEELDFVLTGEADNSIADLARALRGETELSSVPGLWWRDGDGVIHKSNHHLQMVSYESLLPPDFDVCPPMEEYFEQSLRPTILIDSGRGCAFNCEFCQTTLMGGRKVRYSTISRIVNELKEYRERYGQFEAYFVHDLFTARRSFVVEFCETLLESGLDISWQCRCRLDEVDPELLQLMAAAGCRMLLYGVESGSTKVLNTMSKGVRRQTISTIERVQWTIDAGIFPSLSMVIGSPDEDEEDLDATLALANELVLLGSVNAFIQLSSPLAGTALEERVRDRVVYAGETAPNAFSQGIEFLNGKKLPADESLIREHPRIFTSFYSIIPLHGDLVLCATIANSYCKVLEAYGRTYRALANTVESSHLALFKSFINHAGLQGVDLARAKDVVLWSSFKDFVTSISDLPQEVLHVFEVEDMVAEISAATPVVAKASGFEPWLGESYTIAPAVRILPAEKVSSWLGDERNVPHEGEMALFATRDRISTMLLTRAESRSLQLLLAANSADLVRSAPETYRMLLGSLRRLIEEGLVSISDMR